MHLLWIRERLAAISSVGHRPPGIDRQILALAVPALGRSVAEPLFVLVDSAVVGHLGTAPLAGLALASTVLITRRRAVRLPRLRDHGGRRPARSARATAPVRSRSASTGCGSPLGLGVVLAAVAWLSAPWLVDALGATDEVAEQAVTYLRWSAPGLPGMLLVLASTGALRGLLDTRTPLVVAAAGAVVQRGAQRRARLRRRAWGSPAPASAPPSRSSAMAVGAHRRRRPRRARAGRAAAPAPPAGIWANARAGAPLFVRTLVAARSPSCSPSWVATGLGAVALAGHQVVNAVWGLAAFALDALAIAAQALVGHALGAADVPRVRAVLRRTLQWGVGAGAALGARSSAGLRGSYVPLFTADRRRPRSRRRRPRRRRA